MRMPKSALNQYEATFILGEAASEVTAKEKLAALTTTLTEMGGSVSKHELWGKRDLAYPIKRNQVGFYTTFWFELAPSKVAAFEKLLRFDETIIRFLVTLAYTSAQAGSLYPVAEEEEKPARSSRRGVPAAEATGENTGAEAELRRTSTVKPAKVARKTEKATEEVEAESEEVRMEKLDAALDDILKDEA